MQNKSEVDRKHQLEVGGVTLTLEYRHFGSDRGPAIKVYAEVNGKAVQLLRFDCFEKDPHYHYDPEGKNVQWKLDKVTDGDPLTWAIGQLRKNLKPMLQAAGYEQVAKGVDQEAVAKSLPKVKRILLQLQEHDSNDRN